MSRFLVAPEQIANRRFVLTGSEARHAARVLRAKTGDEIDLFDGRDRSYRGRITAVTPSRVEGDLVDTPAAGRPGLQAHVILGQALIKGSKWDWLLEKASEIGVERVVPLVTRRTVIRHDHVRQAHKSDRWSRIAVASAKQCGRNVAMTIAAPLEWGAFLDALPKGAVVLLPWEKETSRPIREAMPPNLSGPVYLLIGPEGGWDPSEVRQAVAAGAVPVRLGPTLLRAETAGLVAATLVLREMGVY